MIRSEDIRDRVRDIDEFLLKKYKESKKSEKRDWRTYEQRLMNRVKGAYSTSESAIAVSHLGHQLTTRIPFSRSFFSFPCLSVPPYSLYLLISKRHIQIIPVEPKLIVQ